MKDGPDGPVNCSLSSSLSEDDEVESESDAAAKKRDIFKCYLECGHYKISVNEQCFIRATLPQFARIILDGIKAC